MLEPLFDCSWIWHPLWTEDTGGPAISGRFVHFRKSIYIHEQPSSPAVIQVSADTKYKLYINSQLVHRGPVKGDLQLWFYDEFDISSYLRIGVNHVSIQVLRLHHATLFATSFARSPFGGLMIRHQHGVNSPAWMHEFDGNGTWQTAIDTVYFPRSDAKGDDFLHIYENFDSSGCARLDWVAAKPHKFLNAFGITSPWKLSPRLIPFPDSRMTKVREIHNISSSLPHDAWMQLFLSKTSPLRLPAGSIHYIELEMAEHMTVYLSFIFERPEVTGSSLEAKYGECYEGPQTSTHVRSKGNRRDTTKGIFGPSDMYLLRGKDHRSMYELNHHKEEQNVEVYSPFHFRTLRVMALKVVVSEHCDIVFHGIDFEQTHYPMRTIASFCAKAKARELEIERNLWEVSLRTLRNCMHDCYEDCPFYEQLQYAMDTRSCALFTYLISGDDRLARQAIRQLHNSFQPSLGLTASRAPCSQLQIIPNFSLFWVLMVCDHFEYFGDTNFTIQFFPVINAILDSFDRRIDCEVGLVRCYGSDMGIWDFVDWTSTWKPFGEVPAARRTGFQMVASALYAYTIGKVSDLLRSLGRPQQSSELARRKCSVNSALRQHCFDGEFFTDGLSSMADSETDYSVHSQVWAVLSGATVGKEAISILNKALRYPESYNTHVSSVPFSNLSTETQQMPSQTTRKFTQPSTAMSFYTLRALSGLGGDLYNRSFHQFWEPWKVQLAQNVTTWVEDNLNQRSDCHAWGSSPLYEFLHEVAGVKPATPGWKSIMFAPRMELYEEIDARVAVKGLSFSAIAHVKWHRGLEDSNITLDLSPDSRASCAAIPEDLVIHVKLPGGRTESVRGKHSLSYTISSDSIQIQHNSLSH